RFSLECFDELFSIIFFDHLGTIFVCLSNLLLVFLGDLNTYLPLFTFTLEAVCGDTYLTVMNVTINNFDCLFSHYYFLRSYRLIALVFFLRSLCTYTIIV